MPSINKQITIYLPPHGFKKLQILELHTVSDSLRIFQVFGNNRTVSLRRDVVKGKVSWSCVDGDLKPEFLEAIGRGIDELINIRRAQT